MIRLDDVLPVKQYYALTEKLMSPEFPWFWANPYIVSTAPKDQLFQFVHHFVAEKNIKSGQYEVVRPIIQAITDRTNIKIKSIIRVKANLIPRIVTCEEWENNLIHQDMKVSGDYISVIYYVNDCDGDTIVYDDDKNTVAARSTPSRNACLIIDSKLWHRSSVPKNNKRRVIINFVFEVESTEIKLVEEPIKYALPLLAITTDNSIVKYDANTNTTLTTVSNLTELTSSELEGLGRSTLRPFGMAVEEEKVYIASNNKLAVYSQQDLSHIESIDVPLYINTHQIIKDGNVIYTCNTSTNTIGIYDIEAKQNWFLDVVTLQYVSLPHEPKHVDEYDTAHVNSLFDAGDKVYFCLHNKGKKSSEYGWIDKATREARIIASTGSCGHNVIVKDDVLYTLSTKTGEMHTVNLSTNKKNAFKIADSTTTFLRGMVYHNGKFIVGCSVNFKTSNNTKHSYLAEIDLIAGTLKKHELPTVLAINDIQVLNG